MVRSYAFADRTDSTEFIFIRDWSNLGVLRVEGVKSGYPQPLALGEEDVNLYFSGVSVCLTAFSESRMSAAALNVDQVSPGNVLDTKSRPIPHLAKSIAVASGKSCGLGFSCCHCIRILDGSDI
jgi:hypothetical protein